MLGHHPSIGFNVSLSGDWVVLAAGPSQRIGIDVERINDAIELEVARRFYAEEEYCAVMQQQTEEQRLRQFFRIWTAKESYMKAIGKGLSMPLDSFSTVKGNALAEKQLINGRRWYFRTFTLEAGYLLTTCADTYDFDEAIQFYDIASLIPLN
ncbi:4'-phosphopantetheinyl transferase family protein [Paenibacillus polymyxa]|uniref:4'-phosphopantetheinyl transferase superfamily protein n=1 Tax=Paenibacillus peoriae TaxID=59893 RepID=A0A7H0Y781_9BACL|nr:MULTISPECIES: 4'-phosphopantetheinyl transferase superfamily protein [Paenibacillus]KOS00856.1 hypothetical protein AM598_20685 [Paenibacillus polymyxa]QNR66939.1 4'-phosphopantetheinyl transferase superfamily protein [Paenibacillus peoriae]